MILYLLIDSLILLSFIFRVNDVHNYNKSIYGIKIDLINIHIKIHLYLYMRYHNRYLPFKYKNMNLLLAKGQQMNVKPCIQFIYLYIHMSLYNNVIMCMWGVLQCVHFIVISVFTWLGGLI